MKNNIDHKEIIKNYNLFFFHEHGVGHPFYMERGLKIKNQLIRKWRDLHEDDYIEIESPQLLDSELWKQSGHWKHFKENMFVVNAPDKEYALKPMSCPGAILFYQHKRRFHSELPLRIAEIGKVHRYENSGSLNGLLRVRSFSQDDAHIFCQKKQAFQEIKNIILLSKKLLNECGFEELYYEVSLRGESDKYLGEESDWIQSEAILKDVLDSLNLAYKEAPGDAKFYGPAIDVHIKDRQGKLWQCSSIQFDFNLSKRFKVSYVNENGEREVPFIIHRALFGSLERFIGILLENFGMDIPFELQPEQLRLLVIHNEFLGYAKKVKSSLKAKGLRVIIDQDHVPLKEKIKRAQLLRVPIMGIIGKKESSSEQLSLRYLDGKVINSISYLDISGSLLENPTLLVG